MNATLDWERLDRELGLPPNRQLNLAGVIAALVAQKRISNREATLLLMRDQAVRFGYVEGYRDAFLELWRSGFDEMMQHPLVRFIEQVLVPWVGNYDEQVFMPYPEPPDPGPEFRLAP